MKKLSKLPEEEFAQRMLLNEVDKYYMTSTQVLKLAEHSINGFTKLEEELIAKLLLKRPLSQALIRKMCLSHHYANKYLNGIKAELSKHILYICPSKLERVLCEKLCPISIYKEPQSVDKWTYIPQSNFEIDVKKLKDRDIDYIYKLAIYLNTISYPDDKEKALKKVCENAIKKFTGFNVISAERLQRAINELPI